MKLLIITQTVDRNDDVLGFFHRWLEIFARKFESITVICLKKGVVELPSNVSVYSLGKENGVGKAGYVMNFIKLIVRESPNYDTVFVHMNQEYVLLGAPIWKGAGKKVAMWRNHPNGNSLTRLAVRLADKVFCTSPSSFTAVYGKTVMMPVGVDTEFFEDVEPSIRQTNSLLFFGRLSPIKRPDLFIESLNILKRRGVKFMARIVGNALPKDEPYVKELRDSISRYGLIDSVKIEPGVPHELSRELYRGASIYLNLTPAGSMDKTIFEAMSSGALPLVHNPYFKGKLNDAFLTEDKAENIAEGIEKILHLSPEDQAKERVTLRKYVEANHSLRLLSDRLAAELESLHRR